MRPAMPQRWYDEVNTTECEIRALDHRSIGRTTRGKQVFFVWFVAILFAVLVGALVPVFAARPDPSTSAGEPQSQQVLGPGKVHLTFTRDGRWLDFTPSWTGGRSLFSVGGLVVYAKGPDGRLSEIVNTATGDIHVSENATRIRRSCEGAQGGSRSPSPNPDDDHDGRVNEDRLDGVDNDRDGRIDEDFAAIGDEMIATGYFAPAIGGAGTQLAFDQESYAWALPHIDGTIMVSVSIKNIGSDALENVRIGAFFEKDGPFYFSNWIVSLPGEREATHANVSVCEDLQGTNMGLVIFPEGNVDGGAWMGGVVEDPEKASAAILGRLSSARRDLSGGAERLSSTASSGGASVFKLEETRVDDKTVVYQASPEFGTLRPGDEIHVDLAFFAVREKTDVETAAINAFKTFVGDGTNRYLPPPVSVTPRVLWGSYRPIENDDSDTPRVAVEFEALGDKPVTPDDISYFNGIDPNTVEQVEVKPGVEGLVLRGDLIQRSLRKGERIILKGRLEDGEFFEAILRPQKGASSAAGTGRDAELFWKTTGRLEFDLLNSSPNPFRDATTISYEIPGLIEQQDGTRIETKEPLETTVKVYNVVGRLVSVLAEEVLPPGTYTTQWRGVDDQGDVVASGVYYVRLQIGKKFLTQRLILLK
jgi:hypothetical protein